MPHVDFAIFTVPFLLLSYFVVIHPKIHPDLSSTQGKFKAFMNTHLVFLPPNTSAPLLLSRPRAPPPRPPLLALPPPPFPPAPLQLLRLSICRVFM